eukprot:5281456-Pyramimonas_sp.AAC.1
MAIAEKLMSSYESGQLRDMMHDKGWPDLSHTMSALSDDVGESGHLKYPKRWGPPWATKSEANEAK